jgi:AcrR family transcriptional regulator
MARREKTGSARHKAKKRGADRAAEIMTAALDLFAEKDYAAVTTTEIARIVGVRHSLIYYYFDSKDDLFHKTIQNFISETQRNYDNMRELHDDPVDRIEYWLANNIELSRQLRKLIKILFDYSGPKGRPLAVDKAIRKFYDVERDIIASGIREGVAQGTFTAVDPVKVAAFVSTHIDGIFFSSLMRPDTDLAADMAELKAVLWQILGYRDAR